MISALIGIALSVPCWASTDFGQIHFLGSVLYSGCYVQAVSQQYRPQEAFFASHRNQVHHFDLNFSYCRLVDNGKVLAEIALANPQHSDFQVFLKNADHYQLVGNDLHQNVLSYGLMTTTQVGKSQLQIQTLLTRPYFDSNTKKTFDIELIYR